MFDNPQQEVQKMSKKLRPVKMSDEEFELFYKEIYAEFGPKDKAPVNVNPKVEETVAAAVETAEAEIAPEVAAPVVREDTPDEAAAREEAAMAAKVIWSVEPDEAIDENTKGVKVKKEKGIRGLVIAICLECLGIAGIVAYWLMYLL